MLPHTALQTTEVNNNFSVVFVFQLINQKIKMCTQLYNSRSFVSVLEYLCAVGNYLNKNAGKQKAKGFRLSSLTKVGPRHHCLIVSKE